MPCRGIARKSFQRSFDFGRGFALNVVLLFYSLGFLTVKSSFEGVSTCKPSKYVPP